jgi:SAM-dependent methyltransferase
VGGNNGYIAENVSVWTARQDDQRNLARRRWAEVEPTWGVFGIPETAVGLLPSDLLDTRVAELGCGTAYVSAWLARRGARPVAIDPTASQLAIAKELQEQHGLQFPLILAAAEAVPLADNAFDLVVSEYGAVIWADPYLWVPEAARLLRPGGELLFLGNSNLLMLCMPDEDGVPATQELRRPQFGMRRIQWPDDPGVEFYLSHGEWIRLLRANGLVVEELLELRPAPTAISGRSYVTTEWAQIWPSEEAWRARRA